MAHRIAHRSRSTGPLTAAVIALAVCATSSACSGVVLSTNEAPPGALALVVGSHANAPAPITVPTVRKLIEQAANEQWQATAVLDGGTPVVVAQGHLVYGSRDGAVIAKRKTANADKLDSVVHSAKVESEEVDVLGALSKAAASLAVTSGPKTIVVIDSGLQTVAPLRMQDPGTLAADPAQVADSVIGALPQLQGVRLVFSGLGETAPPQAPLSAAGRTRLVALWRAIGERAGATVEVLDVPLGSAARTGLPKVSLVAVAPV